VSDDNNVAVRVSEVRKSFQLRHPEKGLLSPSSLVNGGDGSRLEVLKGVSFEVRRGEVFGIVGGNGAGKTTLLRIMSRIYEADSGSVEIAGRLAPFLELGIGFQRDLSARQNVLINGVLLGVDRKRMRESVDQVLAFAQLERFADAPLKNFSSGMRMRLAFGIILEAAADVLILDEILSVGDAAFQARSEEAFKRLCSQGKSVIMVSHRGLEEHCDRAMLLHQGQVETIGDPADVLSRYAELGGKRRKRERKPDQQKPGVRQDREQVRVAKRRRAEIREVSIRVPKHTRVRGRGRVTVRIVAEVDARIANPVLDLELASGDGTRRMTSRAEGIDGIDALRPGEVIMSGSVAGDLAPGAYTLDVALAQYNAKGVPARVSPPERVAFDVPGASSGHPAAIALPGRFTVASRPRRNGRQH
jgi:ABC-type polysaccharide/polyol phosphate transport system ATPase subunit